MRLHWPKNKTINIVCHGHSVPAGYFMSPLVDPFSSYPHLLHRGIKEKFPFAVINVIVTAIGGENSVDGAKRFESQVLNHSPELVTIDYALNDRAVGLEKAEFAWKSMIEKALNANIKVILLTPTWDISYRTKDNSWTELLCHTEQIRKLAEKYKIGLADSFAAFERHFKARGDISDLLSSTNHPTKKGHLLASEEIIHYF